MEAQHIAIAGMDNVPVYTIQNIIIGSGAAGLNCAEHLHEHGLEYAVVTACLGAGTSANSGSDKQTYYKLGLFGDVPDSPMEFARSLFNGGMTHGDIAYVEALGSVPEFFHLVRNGVAFPCNRYGAYVGYKTDHDPRQRATSAGPKTSVQMVEHSLRRLRSLGARIFDGYEVIRLLTAGVGRARRVIGAVALNRARLHEPEMGMTIFRAANVILATGGPGELYAASVYPPGQTGSLGLALEIGAMANNLSESQFGIASLGFRWNLSGTYQQVVPTYISTDARGNDRREFLTDYYPTWELVAQNTFLKGYQWPFHATRAQNHGSSVIDIAVHEERARGRRVFLDFTANPGEVAWDLSKLPDEARQYLERSGATQPTPYERLQHMNPAAIDIYTEHGVDLHEPLEIAVCAQHCNGGLTVNTWWETTVQRLFAIGEVAGTHGVRPGGSALNSGQVGGLRAADYIAAKCNDMPLNEEEFLLTARDDINAQVAALRGHLHATGEVPKVREVRREIQERMTADAAFIRSPEGIKRALADARKLRRRIADGMRIDDPAQLPEAVQNTHLCLAHVAFLTTINDLIRRGGGSRGAYIVTDRQGSCLVQTARGSYLPHRTENLEMRGEIPEVRMTPAGEFETRVTPVRPLPEDDSWYENTWRDWQEGKIYE